MRARLASGDWGRVVGDLRTVARGKPFRVALAISVLFHVTLFVVVRWDPAGFVGSRGVRMLHLHLIEEAPEPVAAPIAAAAPEPSAAVAPAPVAPAMAPVAAKARADERPGQEGPGVAAETRPDVAVTESVTASASPAGAAPAVDPPAATGLPATPAALAEADAPAGVDAPAGIEAAAGGGAPAAAGMQAGLQEQPVQDGSPAGFAAASAAEAGPSGGTGAPDVFAVRRRIDARKVYPRVAIRNGWEGRVLVEMHLDGEGGLKSVRVVEGSGHPVLDEATIASVRRASPFPAGAGTIAVPVEYRLIP